MAIGPGQLLVLGFKHPDFQGEIRQELDRLRDNDLLRVIDALGVRKDPAGEVEALRVSQLSVDQQQAFGALVGGLIGLGAAGEEGFELGAERAPRQSPSAAACLARRRPGTSWLRSPRTALGCWCCWSTAGRSGWCRPPRPKRWPPPRATPCEPALNPKGDEECSDRLGG